MLNKSPYIYAADVAKGWGRVGANKQGRRRQFAYNEGRKHFLDGAQKGKSADIISAEAL